MRIIIWNRREDLSNSINKSEIIKKRLLIICLILLCLLIIIGILEKNMGYRIKYRVITSNKTNSVDLIHNIQINDA